MKKFSKLLSKNSGKGLSVVLAGALMLFGHGQVFAEWQGSSLGVVTDVRTYQAGDGLRAQITVDGAEHSCGTSPKVYFFDEGNLPVDVVKSVLGLATVAMALGQAVSLHYDCTVGSGGFGWGVALQIRKSN